MKIKVAAISLFLIILVINAYSQTNKNTTISGFVYDKNSGETLIGANVSLSSNGIFTGASTNNNGYFIILNAPAGRDTVTISYIGYNSIKAIITVKKREIGPLKFYLTRSSISVGEVVVTGNSGSISQKAFDRPVSTISLSGQQVNTVSKVVEPDLLRALQSMPGITSISDFSSAINVRGGMSDQNLYLIDGAEIYDPNHAFGIFSTFNTDAIKKVEVSKGGFGPQYDDRLSSVIDVIDKDGNRNHFQGNFNLSLIDANLSLQFPLGSLGSISGSFRRTFIDQIYAKLDKDIPPYFFYDGNLKTFLQLSDRDNLTLSFFKTDDNLNFQKELADPQIPLIYIRWGNTLASINWKHLFNDKLFSSFYLTYTHFSSTVNVAQDVQVGKSTVTNPLNDYTARDAFTYYISKEVTLDAGLEYKHVALSYNEDDRNLGLIELSNNSNEISSYFNLELNPSSLWEINAGMRFEDYRCGTAYINFDPRFSMKYKLSQTSALKFAAGIYHQYMNASARISFLPSVWFSADNHTYDSRAIHFILGYEKQIENIFGNQFNLDFETDLYYKDYKNIYAFNQNDIATLSPGYYKSNGTPVYTSITDMFERGDGKSYGIEFLMRKETGLLTGWVSYSLSRTVNTFDGINQGNSFVPRQDRTSVVNIVLNGNLNDIFRGNWKEGLNKSSSNWVLGINFVFTTGQPITLPASAYFVPPFPAWNNYNTSGNNLPSYQLYPGSIDNYRLPDYIRLDLSITWQKSYGTWSIAPFLQIFNIGNRKNVWFVDYSSTKMNGSITQKVKAVNELPILPSLGIKIKF